MELFKKYLIFYGKRFILVFIIALTILFAFILREPKISFFGNIFENPLYKFVYQQSTFIYFIKYLTFAFSIFAIITITLSIYYKLLNKKKEAKQLKIEESIVNNIMTFLYSEKDLKDIRDNNINDLKTLGKTNFKKKILINLILSIAEQTKGEIREKIVRLAEELNIYAWIDEYIKSPYLEDRILAIKAVSHFKIRGFENIIMKRINSKIPVLRTESFIALIRLNQTKDLSFLMYHDKFISMFDINNIVNTVSELNKKDINYSGLINAKNTRVAIIGVVLARKNKRKEQKYSIRKRLEDNDSDLRREAFIAHAALFGTITDFNYITERLSNQDDHLKRAVIPYLSSCNDKDLLSSYLNELIVRDSFTVKIEALKLMMSTNFSSVIGYSKSKDSSIVAAFKEVSDYNIL